MPCEPFVQEREVRTQEVDHAPVFPEERAFDEQPRFPLERLAQVFVKIGKDGLIRRSTLQIGACAVCC